MQMPEGIAIKASAYGNGLFATQSLSKGARIFTFVGVEKNWEASDNESLQVGEDRFLVSTMLFDNFLNHSCDPNCAIDWQTMELVAVRDIKGDEELTFDYCTSEWDYAVYPHLVFACGCASERCIGVMRGLKYLSREEQLRRLPFLSPWLVEKIRAKD